MRTSVSLLAVVAAAIALIPAATAAAAPPDKQATLDATNATYDWSYGPGTGVVFTSTVGKRVGCNAVLFACDFVLLHTTGVGTLDLTTATTDQTLKDIDLHLYESDANGTDNGLWDESTSDSASESLSEVNLPAGYWLVKVDYYLGAGSYTGHAAFTPNPA